MQVRIGIANATKELEFNVEDADALISAYEAAMKNDESMLTITELGGASTMVAIGAIVYISVDAPERPGIGFAAEA